MQKQSQFTEGRIFIPLIRFAVPVFAAICLQAMYGAVDLLVVGQFSDAANVSAVSTGSQMMQHHYYGDHGLLRRLCMHRRKLLKPQ